MCVCVCVFVCVYRILKNMSVLQGKMNLLNVQLTKGYTA